MACRIHHAALSVSDFDWHVAFFTQVFGMEAERADGEAPKRRIWFRQGIQLNEKPGDKILGDAYDHISIGVEDVPATVAAACAMGCTPLPNGAHWFALPSGVRVELKPYRP